MSVTSGEVEVVVRIMSSAKGAGAIRLNKKILEKMEAKPGDYLKLRTYKGNLSAKKVE